MEEYGKAQETLDKLNKELPERLKKSILQEAIQGRLVPQDPNDEPASVLLDRIRKEKAKLVKEGKLKKKDLEEKYGARIIITSFRGRVISSTLIRSNPDKYKDLVPKGTFEYIKEHHLYERKD